MFRLSGSKTSFTIALESPKHISMIQICPKERKRGDYAVVHFLLKDLDIPAENDSQLNEDTELMFKNILEIEVKPLLKQILKSMGKIEAQFKKIPLSEVIKGIRYCQFNALNYLEDARMSLQKKNSGHAYVNVQFSIEELGKAVLLKERAEEAWKNHADEISIRIKEEWKNHDSKTVKALQIIDPKLKILHRKTRLDKTDTQVSSATRLECGFAEFKEDSNIWWLGPVIDKPTLEALINNVEKVLKSDVLLQLPF